MRHIGYPKSRERCTSLSLREKRERHTVVSLKEIRIGFFKREKHIASSKRRERHIGFSEKKVRGIDYSKSRERQKRSDTLVSLKEKEAHV